MAPKCDVGCATHAPPAATGLVMQMLSAILDLYLHCMVGVGRGPSRLGSIEALMQDISQNIRINRCYRFGRTLAFVPAKTPVLSFQITLAHDPWVLIPCLCAFITTSFSEGWGLPMSLLRDILYLFLRATQQINSRVPTNPCLFTSNYSNC
jgi:hypothetical protein